VPPKSFFLPPHNTDLTWVPSCEEHNNANSMDVEYVRTVIPIAIQTNHLARELGAGKVIRTFKKSPGLLKQIYKNSIPVTVNGEETVAFNVSMHRLRKVMEAIAYGLHFHHFERKFYGSWWFYSSTMVSLEAVKVGRDHELNNLRYTFERIPIQIVSTPHPQIFEFGIYVDSLNELLFRFRFYEGFLVFARAVSFHKTARIPKGAF
jgi:hypothetical protein